MSDYDQFRIWHRDLSESQCRERFCRQTGTDGHDLDEQIWRDREDRNARYDRIDNGGQEP